MQYLYVRIYVICVCRCAFILWLSVVKFWCFFCVGIFIFILLGFFFSLENFRCIIENVVVGDGGGRRAKE